jgi:hypothetical protein
LFTATTRLAHTVAVARQNSDQCCAPDLDLSRRSDIDCSQRQISQALTSRRTVNMSWEWDNRYVDFLPDYQARYIHEHEDQRFARLLQALQTLRTRIPDQDCLIDNAELLLEIQPWISHIQRCGLCLRRVLEQGHLRAQQARISSRMLPSVLISPKQCMHHFNTIAAAIARSASR